MSDVGEDVYYSQSVFLTNFVENVLKMLDAVSDRLWNLVVGIPKLDLLENRK